MQFSLLKYDDSADAAGDALKFYDIVNIILANDSVRKREREFRHVHLKIALRYTSALVRKLGRVGSARIERVERMNGRQ